MISLAFRNVSLPFEQSLFQQVISLQMSLNTSKHHMLISVAIWIFAAECNVFLCAMSLNQSFMFFFLCLSKCVWAADGSVKEKNSRIPLTFKSVLEAEDFIH